MTLKNFIKENKVDIDIYINSILGNKDAKYNYEERRLWILNDELLYNWAKREGVRI